MLEGRTVGLIGTGVMAEVLATGLVKSNHLAPENIIASHYRAERLAEFGSIVPVRTTLSNAEAYQDSEIAIICVQPFAIRTILQDLQPVVDRDHLLISIVAGIPINMYEQTLGDIPFIRAMPTFYGRVRIGTTALALNSAVSADQLAITSQLFGSISEQVTVMPEGEIDAFTSFCSTTAAVVYMLLDALNTAGSLVGLRQQMSHTRALEQVIAAAQNVHVTGKPPSQLIDEICTPGGVTVEGVKVLEERAMRSAVIDGVVAATERARELGRDPDAP